MHVNLFFDLYFNFLSVKIEINKKNNKRLNWINIEGSDTLKRQKHDTWIAMWLNHFEIDVVWTAFKGLLRLHSHISVFWGFSWLSMISEFSFLGIGVKTKTWKYGKSLFYSFFSQTLSNLLLCLSFFIFIGRICNSLVQLLFPWFLRFLRFLSFRPGRWSDQPWKFILSLTLLEIPLTQAPLVAALFGFGTKKKYFFHLLS